MLQITSGTRFESAIQTKEVSSISLKQNTVNNYTGLKSLVSQPPLAKCEVCVIVPVRNEASNLEATLLALTNQINLSGEELDKNCYEIIVLANNCTDNSAEIARNFARTQPKLKLHVVEMTITGDRAHIGWVRKLLMDEACRRFKSIGRESGVIASTDGDTRVDPTWIAATLKEINSGADAVGGRIVTDREERLALNKGTRLYFLRYVGYLYLTAQLETLLDFDPAECFPNHHQHYGASFAVTARMYAKVGGLPPLPSSEDVALYEALKRNDARFRHSTKVKVTTSARAIGRAKEGLSDRLSQLHTMAQNHQPMWVESADAIKVRFCLRRRLRYSWHRMQDGIMTDSVELMLIAGGLGLNIDLLTEMIMRLPTFGMLIEQIKSQQKPKLNDRSWQKVTIEQANADLRAMISNISHLSKHSMLEQSQYLSLNALEQIEPISLSSQPL